MVLWSLTKSDDEDSNDIKVKDDEGNIAPLDALLPALQLYETLNIDNQEDKDKLMKYHGALSSKLLEHFINLITKYNHKTDAIYDIAIQHIGTCDVNTCKCTRRHHRDRIIESKMKQNDENVQFIYIRDLFDSIHCYVLHQYDFGYRFRNDQNHKNNMNSNINDYSKIPSETVSKYTITNDIVYGSEIMDELYDILHQINAHTIGRYIYTEQYDSESLIDDLDAVHHKNSENTSNIFQNDHTANKKQYQVTHSFIRDIQISQQTFSTGLIFYYWSHHKTVHKGELEDEWNVNDHGGHNIADLYIEAKYPDLKTEILNNTICTLDVEHWDELMFKVEQFMDQNIVKQTVADCWGDLESILHFGIQPKSALQRNNLLAIKLYTDRGKLCTELSKTFRKCKPLEPLSSIKKRNREYAVWSRLLRETVQYFGSSGRGQLDLENGEKCNVLTGPFFCGMSSVICIPQFNVRLCGPTSTSKQKEVAERFGGEDGIVICLNNNSGDQRCDRMHAFDCCWISQYAAENEYLFIGGHQRIKIQSIIDRRTAKNFQLYIEPLFLFDCLLNGTCFSKVPRVTKQHYEVLDTLMQHTLCGAETDECVYPKYIVDTFRTFVNHKKQIVINISEILDSFDCLMHLVINKEDWTIKQSIFRLFSKTTNFVMYTAGNTAIFELKSLMRTFTESFIEYKQINKITIKATYNPKEVKESWIFEQAPAASDVVNEVVENICTLKWETATNHLKEKQDSLLMIRVGIQQETNQKPTEITAENSDSFDQNDESTEIETEIETYADTQSTLPLGQMEQMKIAQDMYVQLKQLQEDNEMMGYHEPSDIMDTEFETKCDTYSDMEQMARDMRAQMENLKEHNELMGYHMDLRYEHHDSDMNLPQSTYNSHVLSETISLKRKLDNISDFINNIRFGLSPDGDISKKGKNELIQYVQNHLTDIQDQIEDAENDIESNIDVIICKYEKENKMYKQRFKNMKKRQKEKEKEEQIRKQKEQEKMIELQRMQIERLIQTSCPSSRRQSPVAYISRHQTPIHSRHQSPVPYTSRHQSPVAYISRHQTPVHSGYQSPAPSIHSNIGFNVPRHRLYSEMNNEDSFDDDYDDDEFGIQYINNPHLQPVSPPGYLIHNPGLSHGYYATNDIQQRRQRPLLSDSAIKIIGGTIIVVVGSWMISKYYFNSKRNSSNT